MTEANEQAPKILDHSRQGQPDRAEAMLMVAIEIIASDVAVSMGSAEGNVELNAFRPILISDYLHLALIVAGMWPSSPRRHLGPLQPGHHAGVRAATWAG